MSSRDTVFAPCRHIPEHKGHDLAPGADGVGTEGGGRGTGGDVVLGSPLHGVGIEGILVHIREGLGRFIADGILGEVPDGKDHSPGAGVVHGFAVGDVAVIVQEPDHHTDGVLIHGQVVGQGHSSDDFLKVGDKPAIVRSNTGASPTASCWRLFRVANVHRLHSAGDIAPAWPATAARASGGQGDFAVPQRYGQAVVVASGALQASCEEGCGGPGTCVNGDSLALVGPVHGIVHLGGGHGAATDPRAAGGAGAGGAARCNHCCRSHNPAWPFRSMATFWGIVSVVVTSSSKVITACPFPAAVKAASGQEICGLCVLGHHFVPGNAQVLNRSYLVNVS